MFWGAVFRQNDNVKNLEIIIIDFDGQIAPYTEPNAFVGPFIVQAINDMTAAGGVVPTYTLRQPVDFDYEPLNVREAIYNIEAWAAVVINPNATALLDHAIKQGNATYDPAGACQLIYNSARDQTVTSSYVVPSLAALQRRVVATFGHSWIHHLQADFQSLRIYESPQALSPGIDFTSYDLRPFGPPIAAPAVSIGLIYLIIISFFSFTFFLPIHMKYLSPKGHPPLLFRHLIAWRYVATVGSYCFLSLFYSFVSLAILMPMSNQPASHVWPAKNANAYGQATFVVYWMINWAGMTAFGLASENMAMLLGTPWTALWLIFWVISNVATGFYELDLAPIFYRWGYAYPMHNRKSYYPLISYVLSANSASRRTHALNSLRSNAVPCCTQLGRLVSMGRCRYIALPRFLLLHALEHSARKAERRAKRSCVACEDGKGKRITMPYSTRNHTRQPARRCADEGRGSLDMTQ